MFGVHFLKKNSWHAVTVFVHLIIFFSLVFSVVSKMLNPLLHRYSFLRLLQQTTFENIVTKEEIAPAGTISSFATMFSKLFNLKWLFLSAEWTFKIYLNVVSCIFAVWGKGLKIALPAMFKIFTFNVYKAIS